MRVHFVPNEQNSSITPRSLHVFDSYSPVLDQYFFNSDHRTSAAV